MLENHKNSITLFVLEFLDATCTMHTIMYEVMGETLADKNRRERYGVEGRVATESRVHVLVSIISHAFIFVRHSRSWSFVEHSGFWLMVAFVVW